MQIIDLNDRKCKRIQYKADLLVSNKHYNNICLNIYMEMSKEALLGFGKKMIRIASDSKIRNDAEFHTDSIERCASQPLGFFINRLSGDFIMLINDSYDEVSQAKEYKYFCDENQKPIKYCVYPEEEGWIIEDHEIGRYNLAKICVKDICGNDISTNVGDIMIKIGKKGMYEFGKHIIILANNFQKEKIYGIANNKIKSDIDYDFGIFFDNNKLFIRCVDVLPLQYDDVY